MKLRAELSGQHYEVVLQREGTTLSAQVDGRKFNLENHSGAQPGDYLLLEGTRVYNCRVEVSGGRESQSDYLVHVGEKTYQIKLVDPKRLSASQGSGTHQHGSAEIVASMPGKVVRVLVEVGAQVDAGAGIIVVEAMKMQNEIKTPRAGKVAALNATSGDTVNAGEVLAVIT